MRITVQWFPRRGDRPDEQDVEITKTAPSVADVLQQLDEPSEGVLAVRDGTPVPLDTRLVDGERIRFVRTISGG